ncbi:MAG: radical SAM protein [Candidatus Pacebacteria bacterium]|nr:radical SAM protein [Candidatus Paceibacterota bacterium]
MISNLKRRALFFKNSLLRSLSLKTGLVLAQPTFVSLAVANRCCLRCQQCDLWQKESPRTCLSLDQQKKAILEFKNWLGPFKLNLTGGEPFLSRSILSVISYASGLGIETFVNSNGYPINPGLAAGIVRSGLGHLSISLDSHRIKIHDEIRGVKGAFERARKAIDLVQKFRGNRGKPVLSLTTVVMEKNLEDLAELVFLTRRLGLNGINFQPLQSKYSFGFQKYSSVWYRRHPLWPKNSPEVNRVIDRLIELKKAGWPIYNPLWELKRFKAYFYNPNCFNNEPCLVGLSNLSVDIGGEVRLCFSLPPIGNILREGPAAIWRGKEAAKRREQIRKCTKNCRILLCNRKLGPGQILKEAFFRQFRLKIKT